MQGDDANRRRGGQTRRARGPFAALSGLMLLVSLLAGACGASDTTPQGAATATATIPAAPTPTLAPARPLTWQEHRWPVAVGVPGSSGVELALAQSDGNTAYLCSLDGVVPGHAQVWATHDRAAHWTHASDVVAGDSIQSCGLVVDDLQPATIIANVCATVEQAYCYGLAAYLSRDGGATWALVSSVLPFFRQLATRDGETYAITITPGHSACSNCASSLTISRDGMRTWTRIDQGLGYVNAFWLRPDTGELLVETSDGHGGEFALATSSDGGAHWTIRGSLASGRFGVGYVVQAPVPGLPWHACGYYAAPSTNVAPLNPSLLACSADGGRTWTAAGGPPDSLVDVRGIAHDGSVLATRYVPGTQAKYELRRLPPGAETAWESLGPLPAPGAAFGRYVPGGPGVLWLDIYAGGGSDSPHTPYTASYP